jgi:DNA repair protein RadA/Sms
VRVAQQKKPKIMVIDSIQVMHMEEVTSAPGSVSQVRESASMLVRLCQADQYGIDFSWTCHQRWVIGRAKSIGAYD